MAIIHATNVRNGITDYVVDLIDVSGPGTIAFRAGADPAIGGAVVATLTFANPAFDAAGAAGGNAEGVAVANPIIGDSDAVGGTVGHFVVFDGAGDSCFGGTVTETGNGGDIILSSLAVGATDTVEITSLTYTAPN